MTRTWFTADTHFGHTNIIKYCKRPWKTVDKMNRMLTLNWNSRVRPNDIVIHLGDFAFKEASKIEVYLENLNGHITFVKGNHDSNNSLNTRILAMMMDINNKRFYCVHNPREANLTYKFVLCGHVHEKWKIRKVKKTFIINVGVDVWNYAPVRIDEILKAVAQFKRGS